MKKIDFRNFALNSSPYVLGLLVVGFVVIFQYGFYLLQFIGYPLGYGADGLFTMAIAKMYSENGIIFGSYTEQLNYPYSASLDAWYPVPEKLIYYPFGILVKLFGVYSATNLIQLITHIFSALGFIFAARYMGVNRKYAFLGGVVYGLTPFIFSRGLAHLTVGAAWFVPMMSVVILKLMERLEAGGEIESKLRWIAICCAVLGAGLSPYYSFMFGQFLGFILLISLFKKQFDFSRLLLLLLALMAASFFILNIANIANIILYRPASIRNLAALEVYGLKLPELFLPAGFNRLKGLAGFAQQNYYLPAFVKGELWSPYLGLIGVIACVYFLVSQLNQRFIKNKKILNPLLVQASWITIYSLIGGINLIAGVIGFQFIRATNRYSIWLLAIFLLYSLYRVSQKKIFGKIYIYLPLVFLTFVLLWVDMPPPYNANSRNELAQKVISDRQLIAYLELDNVDPVIFTLPLQVFPENGPSNKMLDYDFLRLYLNSTNLKMNFGAVKLDRTTPSYGNAPFIPSKTSIDSLIGDGFNAILINKSGYVDSELIDIVKKLSVAGLRPDFENEYYLAFKLPKRNLPSTGLENLPKLMYTSGWSSQEATWRWAIASRAILSIYCNQRCRSEVGGKELKFDLKSFGEPREIHVSVGRQSIWSGVVKTGLISVTIPISLLTLTQNQIEIRSSGKLISPGGGDNRRISFGVENARIE